jgi:predicted dinucleotide-binding enzyme
VALLYANVAPVVAEFVESLNLRSLDVGGLTMAHWLEGAGLVVMGLSRHGVGNFGFDIKVDDQPKP